jgi:hypothetical protein
VSGSTDDDIHTVGGIVSYPGSAVPVCIYIPAEYLQLASGLMRICVTCEVPGCCCEWCEYCQQDVNPWTHFNGIRRGGG